MADILFRPKDVEDLAFFLQNKPKDIPITLIGAGSNLLIRDGGIDGVVVRLGSGFAKIEFSEETITVGAGCLDRTLALACQEAGIGGLEFLIGIPGTIGGAVRMNAGAYGKEIKDILVSCIALDSFGQKHHLAAQDIKMTYRHSDLSSDWTVVSATLRGYYQKKEIINKTIDSILQTREDSQPTRGRTGGSTFKNPDNLKAWELIDAAGCRGLRRGGAQVSEKHCNFFLNTGQSTAKDLEMLGEEVRSRVLQTSGINLEWEIIRLGKEASTVTSKENQ
jgi:UDP-N-acetylmuramate dehydrogenase